MAKQAQATPTKTGGRASAAPREEEKKAVATRSTAGGVPAHLKKHMAGRAGQGVSKDQADNLVPLIYVLQPLSPQVQKKNPKHVEGAEQGMIWFKGGEVVDGENEGILVQPVSFSKAVLEWVPRDAGGGFVARHREMPAESKRVEDPKNPNKVRYSMPNGNELIETREHVVIVHGRDEDGNDDGRRMPFVIPFSGTGHTSSRSWMTLMNQKIIDGETVPSWFFLYRLKTHYKSNSQGDWYLLQAEDEQWVESENDIEAGSRLYDAFASGTKVVDDEAYGEATDMADEVDDIRGAP